MHLSILQNHLFPVSMHMSQYGLMRYHSAPSSTLTSLVDDFADECNLLTSKDSNIFAQLAEETDQFVQFLEDHLCMATETSFQLTSSSASPVANCLLTERDCPTDHDFLSARAQKKTSLIMPELAHSGSRTMDATPCLLSSILEHNGVVETSCMKIEGHAQSMRIEPANLTRYNSSPANVMSSLVEENALLFDNATTQRAHECGITRTDSNLASPPAFHVAAFNHVMSANTGADGRSVVIPHERHNVYAVDDPQSGLLRQNSSPADLISHISLVDVASTSTSSRFFSSGNSSEDDKIVGGAAQAATFSWDTFGLQRKRGRDFQTQSSGTTFTSREASKNAKVSSNKMMSTEVLCKVSAKRGFATHPRSIAERVRRTKINEGIRKLQKLVPNMEKQTNTITMLDEAVEYVKNLQRQVQELSERSPECDGMCHLIEH